MWQWTRLSIFCTINLILISMNLIIAPDPWLYNLFFPCLIAPDNCIIIDRNSCLAPAPHSDSWLTSHQHAVTLLLSLQINIFIMTWKYCITVTDASYHLVKIVEWWQKNIQYNANITCTAVDKQRIILKLCSCTELIFYQVSPIWGTPLVPNCWWKVMIGAG